MLCCSLSPSGDLSSLMGPLGCSFSKWRSLYFGTGNDRRGRGGSSFSSCSSVSELYHFLPVYAPKPGSPDPCGHGSLVLLLFCRYRGLRDRWLGLRLFLHDFDRGVAVVCLRRGIAGCVLGRYSSYSSVYLLIVTY